MFTNTSDQVSLLVDYAIRTGLIHHEDRLWAINSLLEVLQLDSFEPSPVAPDQTQPHAQPQPDQTQPHARTQGETELHAPTHDQDKPQARLQPQPHTQPQLADILAALTDDAAARGILPHNSVVYRDLFDTALMGRLTPPPREVHATFHHLYAADPEAATDWYYRFSQDTNYIRRDRMAKDMRWQTVTDYGLLDITINLAKPEKDPLAIAAARDLASTSYPQCQLCPENEGYAGRVNHPARQNHRTIPVTINETPWFLQYSPYVYYNEHCIVFNSEHVPMKIDRACFAKLMDFIGQFPHYFVGSNADLPIVGGSILSHDHFQGGCFEFPMERAPIEHPLSFVGYDDVVAGIVRWPLSVLRLTAADPDRLVDLADKILRVWRGYTDEQAFVYAHTDGQPHNTITPIARRRGEYFELDLALRNNITTAEHPLGVYHPHAELHHIKKENIGLIEVMGLAVLPARLKDELAAVADHLARGTSLRDDPATAIHADWAEGFAAQVTPENAMDMVQDQVGRVFATVLEHAGVYSRDAEGREGILRFVDAVNHA